MAVPLYKIRALLWRRWVRECGKVAETHPSVSKKLREKQEINLSLNRTEKAAVIDEVKVQVAKAQSLVMAEYRGTTVSDMTKLRRTAREKGVYLHVLKNTLARRAVAGSPFDVVSGEMSGPLIYGFSPDAVAAAKVMSDFAKTNDKLVIKAGAFEGRLLDKAAVAVLANIPSREVLLAQIAGLLQSPVARFARVLAAVSEKKGGPAEVIAPAAESAAA
jgi:large subunit ribosomal protein L10